MQVVNRLNPKLGYPLIPLLLPDHARLQYPFQRLRRRSPRTLSHGAVLVCILFLHHPPIPTTPRIKFLPILVSYLPTRPTSPILPTFAEALVQIGTNDALVQLGATDVFQTIQRVFMCVVFDETESTRRLAEPVESHNQPLDLPTRAEQRVDLFLGGVETKVPDVERRGVGKLFFKIRGRWSIRRVVWAMIPASFFVLVRVLVSEE